MSTLSLTTIMLGFGMFAGFVLVDDFFGFKELGVFVPPFFEFVLIVAMVLGFWWVVSCVERMRADKKQPTG